MVTMEQDAIYLLHDLLCHVDALPWQLDLFLDTPDHIHETTRAAILNTEEYDDANEHPFARRHGLHYALVVSTVQDIVHNARQQRDPLSPADLVAAFAYYYRNDAFIDFDHHA